MPNNSASHEFGARFHPLYPRVFRVLAPLLANLLRCFAPRWRVTGRHHLPARGAFILVANHVSDADPPFLGLALRHPIHWMAKRELWEDYPILAPIISTFGSFPVDPASPDRAALRTARQILERGEALVVFPEGAVSPTGELRELLPGALALALQSGVPLVPVGLWGTQNVVPYGSLWPRPTLRRVHVHFEPPLQLDDLKGIPSKKARHLAKERLETALRDAIEKAKSR